MSRHRDNIMAHVLCKALRRCGRSDLADEIKDIDRTYKRDQYRTTNDMRLTRAIETTTSSMSVIQQWQRLSQYLGVREKTISDIASTGHDNQWKCQAMLSEWRKSEPRRGQRKLVQSLRQVGCNCVADHLVSSLNIRPKTTS